MIINIANSYASVLFNYANKTNSVKAYYDIAHTLYSLLNNDKNFANYLNDINIDKLERKNKIKELFSDCLPREVIYFLWSVIDFNRTKELIKIFKNFMNLCQNTLGIKYIQVTTAYQLSIQEKQALTDGLKMKYGFNKIQLHNHVDKSIIGGIKLKMNSEIIDDTIKNKLDLMKANSFKSIQKGD
ncbi:MAG: ATP synthase F1 subunit delta [Mycoplasmataceae bacterium]|jgi:F-type H+-transporting ATPase subunit delta|nr:ATP synthase F1 subunit delta [Mycoplasmataceae bacterium]